MGHAVLRGRGQFVRIHVPDAAERRDEAGRAYGRGMGTDGATGSRNTAAAEDVAHLLARCLEARRITVDAALPLVAALFRSRLRLTRC